MTATLTPTGTTAYGAKQYHLIIDGNIIGLLTKTQHPANAFESARRFWTLTSVSGGWQGEQEFREAVEGLRPLSWDNLLEARAAIENHFKDKTP